MDSALKTMLWQQFGASMDMLENAMNACPDEVWGNATQKPESMQDFWYIAFHTLFWLDFYLSTTPDGFMPPAPYTLGEFDPGGVMPDRVYSKAELLAYLEHGREKCRTLIAGLTDERAQARFRIWRMDYSRLELLLYNMRHVQHHAAQLNLLLRQHGAVPPDWVGRTKRALDSA